MPELPEVEVARRQISRWLAGRPLTAVHLEEATVVRTHASTLPRHAHPQGHDRVKALVGTVLEEPLRHGKRLGLRGEGVAYLVHLGMTGRWVWRTDARVPRFGKIGLQCATGIAWFADMRRFGCIVPVAPNALEAALCNGHGPDALEDPLDGPGLAERFITRKAIKVALMDQERLTGLGNIHAAEALFRAGIHPARPARELDADAWARLAAAIPQQLHFAIGVTDVEEVEYMTDGKHVANPFAVYGRSSLPCRVCGSVVAKARHGGRATYWCPGCQPA